MTKKCKQCGEPIRKFGKKFCNAECYHQYRKKNKTDQRIEVECQREGCSNTFLTWPSRIKDGSGKYCSKKCFYIDRKEKTDKNPTCRKCGALLNDNNWWPGSRKSRDFRCKNCQNKRYKDWVTRNQDHKIEYGQKYRERTRDERLEYKKEYRRNNQRKIKEYEKRTTVTTENGKKRRIIALKRDITPFCEICGRSDMKLSYHHKIKDEKKYVPNKILPGIWVDLHCHGLCHSIEDMGVKCICESYSHAWENAYCWAENHIKNQDKL